MTSHLAYPNVLPREDRFIGCGRYAVFSPDETPSAGYRPVVETPNTPNRNPVEHAIQILCPESYDARAKLFEKPDEPERVYQGNSMDLAYVLAHIHRCKVLRKFGGGDIWCTGILNVQKDTPVLGKVDPRGFDLKLDAFFSEANPDSLFIVPAANVTDEIAGRIESAGGRVISIRRFGELSDGSFKESKIVLKVLSNELKALLEILFQNRTAAAKRPVWILCGVAILLVAVLSGWGMNRTRIPSPGEILKLLEAGDISEAKRLVSLNEGKSPEIGRMSMEMKTPVEVDIQFVVQKARERQPVEYSLQDETGARLTLSHEDDYRFQIQAGNPSRPLFMYLFQMDDKGSLDRIFPNPNWQLKNPVGVEKWPVAIPPGVDEWVFLEPLTQGRGATLRETLLALVSPWRALDVESLYDEKILNESDRSRRRGLIEALAEAIRQRGGAGVASIYVKEWSFEHVN